MIEKLSAKGCLFFLIFTLFIGGYTTSCSSPDENGGTTPRTSQTGVKLQNQWLSFSDMMSIWDMESTEEHLWVGTPGGLLRYQLSGGTPLILSKKAGPGGQRVVAIEGDDSGRLWALSEGGLARYEGGAWSRPAGTVPEIGAATALGIGQKNQIWVGGSDGLLRYAKGRWERWARKVGITSIAVPSGDDEPGIWVGTSDAGIWHISNDGIMSKHTTNRGMPCDGPVRAMIEVEGQVWALCQLEENSILAHFDGSRWKGYTTSLSQRPSDLGRCRNNVILLTDSGLWRLMDHEPSADEPPARGELPLVVAFEGIRMRPQRNKVTPGVVRDESTLSKTVYRPELPPLRPVESAEMEQAGLKLSRVTVPLRRGGTVVQCDSRGIWLGTNGLGVTRVGRGGQTTDYRTLELVVTERSFTVAADGEGRAWFLTRDLEAGVLDDNADEGFGRSVIETDVTAGIQILSFGSRGTGAYALGRMRGTNVIRIYQHAGSEWVSMLEREINVGDDLAEFSFFEVDPQGRFWIGLSSRPRSGGDARPRGVIVVDLEVEEVTYHGPQPRGPDAVPVPAQISVVDFTSEGVVWLGGLTGATVVHPDGIVDQYSEANGLLGDIVSDLAVDDDDVPWVATPAGLGCFRGGVWRFRLDDQPENLHVLSVTVDSRGELWGGGNRGAVHFDGEQWEVLTTEEGLISDRVRSVHVDGRDRVWFVTEEGISIFDRSAD